MALKFDPKGIVRGWPVTVSVPADKGEVNQFEIHVDYELLTVEELQNADKEPENILLRKVKGWGGITDVDGNPIPFSEDNLRALLGVMYIESAMSVGLLKASRGSAVKN